jgi:hypothetical protein
LPARVLLNFTPSSIANSCTAAASPRKSVQPTVERVAFAVGVQHFRISRADGNSQARSGFAPPHGVGQLGPQTLQIGDDHRTGVFAVRENHRDYNRLPSPRREFHRLPVFHTRKLRIAHIQHQNSLCRCNRKPKKV